MNWSATSTDYITPALSLMHNAMSASARYLHHVPTSTLTLVIASLMLIIPATRLIIVKVLLIAVIIVWMVVTYMRQTRAMRATQAARDERFFTMPHPTPRTRVMNVI